MYKNEESCLSCCGCKHKENDSLDELLEYCLECKRAYKIDTWRQIEFDDLYKK